MLNTVEKTYREVVISETVNEDNNSRAQFSHGDIKGSIQSDPSEVSSISPC